MSDQGLFPLKVPHQLRAVPVSEIIVPGAFAEYGARRCEEVMVIWLAGIDREGAGCLEAPLAADIP